MIPITLQVAGFLSYFEPVEVDFTRFDMACISGANGAGKSSLLDAITWALFGQARARSDAVLNNHKQNKAAEVTFTFGYEGSVYRVQRSKARDRSAVLEFHIQAEDGGWKALTESSLRATEALIEQTLRLDYDTFINASFFLQGKADQFAQQGPGDRKRILSSILGLEIWEQYRERAGEERKNQEAELREVDARLKEAADELAEEPERRRNLKALEEHLKTISDQCRVHEKYFQMAQNLEEKLKSSLTTLKMLTAQRDEIQARLAQHQQTLTQRREERDQYRHILADEQHIRQAHAGWQSALARLESLNAAAEQFNQQQAQRSAALSEIEKQRSVLEQDFNNLNKQDDEHNARAAQMPALQAELQKDQQAYREYAAQVAETPHLEADQHALLDTISTLRGVNQGLRDEMNALKERITRLRDVDEALCPLCGQPLGPTDRLKLIAELEAQGKEKGGTFRANEQTIAQSEEQLKKVKADMDHLRRLEQVDLRQLHARIAGLETGIRQNQAQLEAWEEGGKKRMAGVRRILDAQDYAQDARAELEKVDAALRELGYDLEAHAALRRAEQAGRASADDLLKLEAARSALEPLQREIASLEKQVGEAQQQLQERQAQLDQAQRAYDDEKASLPDLREIEENVRSLREEENRTRQAVGGARQRVDVLENVRQKQAELNSRREQITRQVARLKMLERAFGKDGVPALLIEQELQVIEDQANEILDRLSAGGMSVRFSTLRDYKDKKRSDQKETLDIYISDAAGEREYEMFSGGEAFRINFAIRLALSRVLAQRAGARLQTLVIDEGFGSQDADGRQRLLQAINQVQPDFAKVLVITHLEELKDHFPARIEVEKTASGSTVSVK